MRRFTLRDGNHIREQLLALSDRDHVSTYCILDATLPMRRYVATVQLKRVTDGERTFWHWQSTFDAPPRPRARVRRPRRRRRLRGRLRGPARLPATSAGTGARAASAPRERRRAARPPSPRRASSSPRFGGPEVLRYQPLVARRPRARARCASARRRSASTTSTSTCAPGLYRLLEPPAPLGMEAAGVVVDVGDGVAAPPARRPRRLRVRAARRLRRRAHACRPTRSCVLPDDVDDETAAARDAEGHDRRVPAAPHASRARGRDGARARRRGRRRALPLPVGAGRSARGCIGTVSSEDKARLARDHGCELPHRQPRLPVRARPCRTPPAAAART